MRKINRAVVFGTVALTLALPRVAPSEATPVERKRTRATFDPTMLDTPAKDALANFYRVAS